MQEFSSYSNESSQIQTKAYPVSSRDNSGYVPTKISAQARQSKPTTGTGADNSGKTVNHLMSNGFDSKDTIKRVNAQNRNTPNAHDASGGLSEDSYPIFFRKHDPISFDCKGHFWQDRTLSAADNGPHATAADAEADWALAHFTHGLQRDLQALDVALGSAFLAAPLPGCRDQIVSAKVNELMLAVELEQAEFIGCTEQALAITESLVELADLTGNEAGAVASGSLRAELAGNLLLMGVE